MGINREIRYETAGNSTGVSQVFYNNYLADSRPVQTNFFSFEKPMFYTYGGTLDYYGQDPYSIFTSLIKPSIRFVFSANTFSLSGDSYFVHEIYKLDYDIHKLFSDNQIDIEVDISNNSESNDISVDGNPPSSNAQFRGKKSTERLKSGNNLINLPEKFFGEPLTDNDKATIQKYFSNPILIITAATNSITGNVYDLYLDQYAKKYGKYKMELFSDKAQYFINTKIVFNLDLNQNYSGFFNNSNGLQAKQEVWNNVLQVDITNNSPKKIEGGFYSGINIVGNFFTYFIVPDKPVLEYPIMSGQLTTFTPEFRWSNGDNADSFIIQISYNIENIDFKGEGDKSSENRGSVINYLVPKVEKNIKNSRSRIKFPNSEFESDKSIYTFQIPIKSNSQFIYRIGNSKEIIDIFNIRRNVVTFSDVFYANTQIEPIKVYVRTETDSPFISTASGFNTPPSLDYESPNENFTLYGAVSGSIVTGATMTLIYPNSSFIVKNTDTYGNYLFTGLGAGVYTLTTDYRGYNQDIRSIIITGDTNINFEIQTLWSNEYDTWYMKENDIINY